MTDVSSGGGERLGSRYELREQIGRGAAGAVWRAWDLQANEFVAAKILWPQFQADEEVLTRFIRERTILIGLEHPNIVRVRDMVVEGENLAIIMDLVEGKNLGALRKSMGGTLPASRAVPFAAAMLDALAYAHSQGILHRDVKPDNILLAALDPGPEDVRLADFGIARLARDGFDPGTETLGTPYYMPPELVVHGKFGPVSDVYSVGIALYELLAGRTPFAGVGNEMTIGLRHVQSAPPRLPVDRALWTVLSTMLAKNPAHRLPAAEAALALQSLPASALSNTPLTPQAEPADWAITEETLPSKETVQRILAPDRTAAVATAPPEGPTENGNLATTNLRSSRPKRQGIREATVVDQRDKATVDLGNMTMMRSAASHGLQVEIAPALPTRKRRTLLLAGLAAVGVLAITGGALWAFGMIGRGNDDTEAVVPITTQPAYLAGETAPSGLRIDLDASYDSSAELTELRVALRGPQTSDLRGDVLLVIPGLGDECPTVTTEEGSSITTLKASTDGYAIDCGYRLSDVTIGAPHGATFDLSVDLDLTVEDSSLETYSTWLDSISQDTVAGLASVTGSAFPLQRVSGIRVEAESVTMKPGDGTSVPYTVSADWLGGSEASPPITLLTDSTVMGMETELLQDLTGGAGLDGVTVSSCDGATVRGIRVLALQPTDSCALAVQIGALTSPQAGFRISMR